MAKDEKIGSSLKCRELNSENFVVALFSTYFEFLRTHIEPRRGTLKRFKNMGKCL
jgi:hypothetical protein